MKTRKERRTERKAKRPDPTLTPEEMERIKAVIALKGMLTGPQTAFWLGVKRSTLNVWRCTKRYEAAGLVPTYSGAKPMYRVEDVLKFQASGRGRRAKRTADVQRSA